MNRQDIVNALKNIYAVMTDGTVKFVDIALAEDTVNAHPSAPLPELVHIVQRQLASE